MNEDVELYQCKECGWVHEAISPQFNAEDSKHSHCANCYAEYTEFVAVTDKASINPRRYKPGLKILVD